MIQTILLTMAAANQFTGFELTQIQSMLSTLAAISIIVWVIAVLLIIACKAIVTVLSIGYFLQRSAKKLRGNRHAH